MRTFEGKTAVVTGAASGIGRALAARFAKAGMKVVLADVERDALAAAETELKAGGAEVLAVETDVSKPEEVDALAARTVEVFGGVHILCNNAGVGDAPLPSWERSLEDWKWVLGVNLWGVIHGIRAFVPIMLRQGVEAHVVNTASVAGLISMPFASAYAVTKHGVVALSESLHHELTFTGAPVRVSVLCPAWVRTRILDAQRNRPGGALPWDPRFAPMEEMMRGMLASGMPPEAIADAVFEAVRDEKFYVLTHPEQDAAIRRRMEAILERRNPVFEMVAGGAAE